jgi:amidohydrolase
MELIEEIKQLAKLYTPDVIEYRRHIHANPELSFEEENTANYIALKLEEFGIQFEKGIGGHGIVGLINGNKSKIIALRADMDALPILEQSDKVYCSKVPGVMHACGHDVHTASLLGAARILNQLKDKLDIGIKLIFQPGEEKLPGGASLMIKDGVLTNPTTTSIFGQHVFPSMSAGKVGIRSGLYMASADEIYITIKGKGGHAATPHDCKDTILMASHVILALQSIAARSADPAMPTVLSIGKINSMGGATNIIPEEVTLEGTLRTMDEKWRFQAHDLIRKIVGDTVSSFGGEADVNIMVGYPCLINDTALTLQTKDAMIEYMGADNVVDLPIRMTAEDFAFYTQKIPGCFYRLGTGNKELGITSPVHTPTFDIDESALTIGMGLMAYLGVRG